MREPVKFWGNRHSNAIPPCDSTYAIPPKGWNTLTPGVLSSNMGLTMPYRETPLVAGEVYHVFNRGIDRIPTFTDKREYGRALETVNFYRFSSTPIKFSRFLKLNDLDRNEVFEKMKLSQELVEILCFCFMPNHFHFLIRQLADRGISQFISIFLNSYTRYFNTKKERVGPLFLDQFKAVRMERDEQLLHVSRYIHLNPYTGFLVQNEEQLEKYDWSSFRKYLNLDKSGFCKIDEILSFFKDPESYKEFVLDRKDYQRKLQAIKHLIFE